MIVFVNETKVETAENANISYLLSQLNTPTKGIAIAINEQIIPASQWNDFQLQGEEKVLIIRATQGG